MRPTFSITANGSDITGSLSSRLVSLEVIDTVDETSDTMTMTLEDVAGTLALPKSGAKIEVSIGYNFLNTRLGSFVVDEVEINGPPDVITVRGSSTPFVTNRTGGGSAEFQSKKTRSWDGKTIGEIVATVASECGLTPVVDDTLKNVVIPHIDQLGESDANLLIRIARRYAGVLKPADGRLVLAAEQGGQTTSGKPLGLSLEPGDVKNYRVMHGGKLQGVTKVRGKKHNYQTGESEEIVVDVEINNTPDNGQFSAPEGATGAQVDAFYERILADSGGDVNEAKASVKSDAKRIARNKRKLDLTLPGRADIVAGMNLTLKGFRNGISGEWKILTVRHTLSRNGWLTAITGEAAQ
jgi:phage protein D